MIYYYALKQFVLEMGLGVYVSKGYDGNMREHGNVCALRVICIRSVVNTTDKEDHFLVVSRNKAVKFGITNYAK